MSEKLTGKQQRFVEEYCHPRCRNATEAAIKAGYSEKTAKEMGYENLTKPHIKKAVIATIARDAEKVSIDREWVLAQQVKLYQRCMQEEAVKDSEGNPTGTYKFEANAANKALDQIAKHIDVSAYEAQKIEHSGEVDHKVKIVFGND